MEKKSSQENASDAAGRPKGHWHTLVPAVSLIIIVMATLIGLNCNADKDTSTEEPSKVAQSDGETANVNPPPEHTIGGPSIYFPESSHDFGNIAQREKVSYTFIVQNYGDKPLKLIKAKGS